jgi:hypothetical protein
MGASFLPLSTECDVSDWQPAVTGLHGTTPGVSRITHLYAAKEFAKFHGISATAQQPGDRARPVPRTCTAATLNPPWISQLSS